MSNLASRICLLALAAPFILAQAGQPGAPAPAATQRGANVRQLAVDWTKAQQDRRARVQQNQAPRLQKVTQQQLDAAHLPVLLPDTDEMRAAGVVFPRLHSYAATLTLPGATVEVFGSSLAARVAPAMEKSVQGRMKLTTAGYMVSDSEYGQEISLTRYGVAYSVTITCAAPQTDDRCTKPDFLVALADKMAMFGGTPEAGP